MAASSYPAFRPTIRRCPHFMMTAMNRSGSCAPTSTCRSTTIPVPAFRNTARMTARLYAALHDDKRKHKMLLPTDTGSGGNWAVRLAEVALKTTSNCLLCNWS